jgi:hypothetical protein
MLVALANNRPKYVVVLSVIAADGVRWTSVGSFVAQPVNTRKTRTQNEMKPIVLMRIKDPP